ncbi:MAG: hypothetical protein AB7O59_24195 [Pirellulales bacterium]
MDAFNYGLTRSTDWLLAPLSGLAPWITLLVWSALAGVLMAVVFLYTSNQQAIKRAADRSRAQVLAINLFGHDPRTILTSFARLLGQSGLRLWLLVPPVLVMLVPFGLLLAQMALRYEHTPLAPGKSAIVKLEINEADWPRHQQVALEPGPDVIVETPALRDAQEHAIYWRLRPTTAASGVLRWRVGDDVVEKRLDVDSGDGRLSNVSVRRPGRGWLDRLLNPGEPALTAGSPVCGIEIAHPLRSTRLLGLDPPWWLTFLAASIVVAMLLRPILHVRF